MFIFIQVLIENYASKQWKLWSDAAFCGVWSGSALIADGIVVAKFYTLIDRH